MKTSELTKKLKEAGCQMVEHGSEHDKWYRIVRIIMYSFP